MDGKLETSAVEVFKEDFHHCWVDERELYFAIPGFCEVVICAGCFEVGGLGGEDDSVGLESRLVFRRSYHQGHVGEGGEVETAIQERLSAEVSRVL